MGGDNNKITAPVPIRGGGKSFVERPHTSIQDSRRFHDEGFRSLTPNTTERVNNRRPSYNSIQVSRESHYNLDYPEDKSEVFKLQLDPESRFYSRKRPRTFDLPRALPYETELPKDQAKFLSHIVSHLYIAIKTLDIQGSLSVNAKDLASLKNVSGISDLDIALDTNLFELNTDDDDHHADDESNNYFSVEEYSESDSDYEEDDAEHDADDDKDRNESVVQYKKSPKSAAVVGVRTWTNELLVWLKMKYDMPVKLRIALAKVYYAICLCRGQYINLKIYVKTFELLTKDVHFLKECGLRLEWEDLYLELANHFTNVDSTVENLEEKEHKQLLRIAERASNFFDPDALPIIYGKLGQNLSVSNPSLIICSMALLPLSYTKNGPDDIHDIRHYIASFFYIWEKFHKSIDLSSHLTSRLGTIAMSSLINHSPHIKLGPYGVFNENQFQILVNNLLTNLGIRKDKFGSITASFFHGYSSAIAYSISGPEIINTIESLLNAIESYVHPTNSGVWTKSISKFIYSLVYQFHKRYNQEREENGLLYHLPEEIKLNKQVVDRFVTILLPIIRTGLQSKKQSSVENYLNSLGLLAYLNSEVVLEAVLLDIYESLEGVISTHRVSVAIRSLDELSRYFAATKVYRVHLTRLLSLAVPGIDSNDLEKTLITLNLFETVANFVPFHDLTEGDGDTTLAIQFTQEHKDYLQLKVYQKVLKNELNDDMMVDFTITDELELEALKSSSAAFDPLMKTFLQRIFTLLENIPDPNKSGKLEKTIADSLPKFLYIIFESLSDNIFERMRDLIFDFVFENTIHTVADIIAEVCGGIIKRDPKGFPKYGDLLVGKIMEEIEENGSGNSRTGVDIVPRDQPLFWYLVILNECIGNASSYVVKMGDELKSLIFFLMENVRGPTVFASSYLVNQILQAVTKIKIKELRLISPQFQKRYGVNEECWGAFQFDKRRLAEENVKFDWFIPEEQEVKFAVSFFSDITSKILGNILLLMQECAHKKSNSSVVAADELKNNFFFLSYSLSGISFLLDPSFEEDIPKLHEHHNETIQQRLLLLKQIRSVNDATSKGTDEPRIEDLQENLQKIVDNMSSSDSVEDFLDVERNLHNDGEKSGIDDGDGMHHKVSLNEDFGKRHLFDLDRSVSTSPDIKDISRASPGIDGVAVSQMNPAITFRERKLYTSRYYFGDDMETRRTNDLYLKLHSVRYSIGRSLHIICKFLVSHFHDNTKLFKHFLYVLNVWISDVGRERLLDTSHCKVDYTFISATQSINRVHKPFTRIALGARLEAYHLLRVALHATSRTQTNLDKLLLEDLVKLTVSTYSAISKPAQGTLIDSMKRLNGSYNVIVKSGLKHLAKAVKESNMKQIESGLSLFNLRKIKSKIENDYFNIQKLVTLLQKCLLIDAVEVNEIAQSLFKSIHDNITFPSSVCLINLDYIDTIRPPDAFIDLEIKAVTLAKKKKKELYFEKLKKLENAVLLNEQSSTYWKLSSLNLSLLINLQLDFEVPSNDEVFRLFAKEANSGHPVISRIALKGFTKIVSKIYHEQLIDYKIKDMHDLSLHNRDTKLIKTSGSSDSYFQEWKKEMENFTHPNYFIDNKASNGWLFWGDEMKVVREEPLFKLSLNENDLKALTSFGNCISKLWFHEIAKLWVTDNEVTSAYQATDVYLTSAIVLLISNDLVAVSFGDLLDIIEDIYEKDDKSSHIVSCELIAGILISSKFLNPKFIKQRDEFLVKFLTNVMNNDLSPDTKGVWNVFSWWVPSHTDTRRFPEVFDVITKFKLDKNSDFAIRDSTRLTYIKSFIASVTWRFPHPEEVVDLCVNNINHHYQAVREQIGSLLSLVAFIYYPDSIKDFKTFTAMCNLGSIYDNTQDKMKQLIPVIFDKIEEWRQEVVDKTSQEILKSSYIYAAMTVLTWLEQGLVTSSSIAYQDFAASHIVPFLLRLINLKEVCQLGNIQPITALKSVSQIQFNSQNISLIVQMLQTYSKQKNLTVVQCIVIGEFTETFYFKNLLKLSREQRAIVINFTNELLYHKQVGVRESAASTLSGLIHISPPEEVEDLIKEFTLQYTKNLDKVRRVHRKTGYKNMSADDLIILHGATLGLGSLIHAFSFLSPPPYWVPELLSILSNKSSGIPGLVGKTSKDSLSKFKKTRQDTWHIDSKVFNESQIRDLEGVLLKSYFV